MDAVGHMQLGKSPQPKHKPKPQGKTQIPARFASHHPENSKANSERGKSPTRKTTSAAILWVGAQRLEGADQVCRRSLLQHLQCAKEGQGIRAGRD